MSVPFFNRTTTTRSTGDAAVLTAGASPASRIPAATNAANTQLLIRILYNGILLPIAAPHSARLTTNQVRGFWAAWLGWALDGMDSFIYALVLVPAMRDLLPRSGIAADQ